MNFIKRRDWRREKVPWQMELDFGDSSSSFFKDRKKWRFLRYVPIGTLNGTVRTVAQEAAAHRSRKMIWFLVVLALLWFVFWLMPMPI